MGKQIQQWYNNLSQEESRFSNNKKAKAVESGQIGEKQRKLQQKHQQLEQGQEKQQQ